MLRCHSHLNKLNVRRIRKRNRNTYKDPRAGPQRNYCPKPTTTPTRVVGQSFLSKADSHDYKDAILDPSLEICADQSLNAVGHLQRTSSSKYSGENVSDSWRPNRVAETRRNYESPRVIYATKISELQTQAISR